MSSASGGGGTRFGTPRTDSWGLATPARSAGPVQLSYTEAFPEALFTITAQPGAMRSAAEAYRAYGTSATAWERQLDGLDAPFWLGAEGDTYRQSRLAYKPMLQMAALSFPLVAREVEVAATTIEAIIRTMDALRPSARSAWERLQRTKSGAAATQASTPPSFLSDPTPASLDPQVMGAQRQFDLLCEEARTLQRRIVEAATQAGARIGQISPPGPVPSRGADPFGPIVEERQTDRHTLEGSAKVVMGGLTYTEITEKLSDETFEVRYVLGGTVGAELSVESDLVSSKDDTDWTGDKEKKQGGSTSTSPRETPNEWLDNASEQLPDQHKPDSSAAVSGQAGLAEEHIWTGSTEEEARAKARAGLWALIFGGLPGMPTGPKEDGRATSGRLTVSAEAMAGLADAKLGGHLSTTVGVRDEGWTDGRRSTSMSFTGLAEVEHPVPAKNGLTEQKADGGSGQVTATVRTTAAGGAWLDVVTRKKKAGENTYVDVVQRRAISKEQVRYLRNAPRDLVIKRNYSKTSDCVRALALIADTAALTKDSPQVRSGLVDYKELPYESETTNEQSAEQKVFGIGVEESADRTTEHLVR